MRKSINPIKLFTILMTASSALTLSSSVCAAPGDGTGNGGSPVLLRMKLIKEYINSELRNDALAYMSNLQLDKIASPTAQRALKRMLEKDILNDIRTSSYVLQTSCKVIGGQDAGGAINGDVGGDICLSPKTLAELDSTKAEIVGLAIHEHAHHFGYDDKDYSIYKAVYQTARLANPLWSDAETGQSPAPSPGVPVSGPGNPNTSEACLKGWLPSEAFLGADNPFFSRQANLGTNSKTLVEVVFVNDRGARVPYALRKEPDQDSVPTCSFASSHALNIGSGDVIGVMPYFSGTSATIGDVRCIAYVSRINITGSTPWVTGQNCEIHYR